MNKLLSTITDTISGAKTELSSYVEQGIDLAADNDLWENVPIVDQATKLLNIRDVYKKNRVKRNYEAFLKAVGKMNELEVSNYSKILFQNNELSAEVAETIFEIVADSEKPLKAELLGRLSLALSRYEIRLEDYNTILLIIQPASIAALRALPKFLASNNNSCHLSKPGGIPEECLLLSLGIAMRHGNMFRVDKTGQQLAKFGFGIIATI